MEHIITFTLTPALIILIIWSLIWKGLALWRAAQSGQKVWYILFLILNTAGLLEIIYIFLINPKKKILTLKATKPENK